jgi:hypothetical protein
VIEKPMKAWVGYQASLCVHHPVGSHRKKTNLPVFSTANPDRGPIANRADSPPGSNKFRIECNL